MKRLMIAVLVMIGFSSTAQDTNGEIHGYLHDKTTGEELISAHVFIKDVDKIYQAMTATDGSFRLSAIPAGVYTLQVKYDGDTFRIYPVNVSMNLLTQLGKIEIDVAKAKAIGGFVVTPGIRLIGGDLPVPTLTAKEISQSVSKFDMKGLITGMSSEVRQTEDGELVFRGARKGDMLYMIDGVKGNEVVRVPSAAIGHMMVYTGALPAKYGDTLGGVVVVETKSYFDLYRAWMAGRD